MFLMLLDDTVVLLKRVPVLDGQGNSTYDDYGTPIMKDVPTPLVGVSIQPMTTTETVNNTQDIVTDRWRGFGPLGMGLSAADHLVWNGLDLQVDGTPMEWTQVMPHTEFHLVKWSG